MAPAGDMFQKKTGELFHGISNVFGISDDTVIAGFDELGRDHDATLGNVLRIIRLANLKLNRDKSLFRCTSIPFLVK